ncbi:hypothetical protein P7K49_033566 [Saguinus oedipus]|uniref:Bone marrow stromal antigen 2 n=1 Tax=Saguinus oedipus TaxID=9490 RepID=A0ABQ9TSA8_SAGOE|nr:hypothetical protein P7K49_033566 [Saguinus oedipus]
MDDFLKHERKERCKLPVGTGVVVLLVIVAVALGVLLIIYVQRANSEACQEGRRAVMECQNVTHLLEQELTRAQDGFRDAEAQVATYNQTVMTLMASLDKEKAHSLDAEKKVEELEGEITTLNRKLQDASTEVERLRSEITFPSATLHLPHPSHPRVPTRRPRISLAPKIPIAPGGLGLERYGGNSRGRWTYREGGRSPVGQMPDLPLSVPQEEKPGLKRENRGPEGLRQLPEGHQLRGGASAPGSAAGPRRSAPLRSREAEEKGAPERGGAYSYMGGAIDGGVSVD